jgi:hypothetical protein
VDKSVVEVAESKETAYFFHGSRLLPICYSLNFDRVHFDLSIANNHSQIFDFLLREEALLGFEEEV